MALPVADLLLIDSWQDDRRRKKPVRKPMAESAVSPLGFLVCFIRLLSSLVMLNLERGQQGPKKAAARGYEDGLPIQRNQGGSSGTRDVRYEWHRARTAGAVFVRTVPVSYGWCLVRTRRFCPTTGSQAVGPEDDTLGGCSTDGRRSKEEKKRR